MPENRATFADNVIVAYTAVLDRVAFDLTVNFERIIQRRIPKADTARWLECIALDGGLKPGKNAIDVILVYDKGKDTMEYFEPDDITHRLNGKAFAGNIGEFSITTVETEDNIVTRDDLFADIVLTAANDSNVKRLMVVPDDRTQTDGTTMYSHVRQALRRLDDDTHITLFAMQPMPTGNYRQEILGYSMMAALGIRADEINN